MAELLCVMCKENKAGGDGLCVKCRFKMNTQQVASSLSDEELLLPEGRYYGKTRNGIPNGRGELTYNDGDSRKYYHGEFKDGMRHGKGKLVFRNDAYYDGEWVHDKYDGYGEESTPGGNVLEGYYEQGRLISGHVFFGDGREYEGEWNNDLPNGMGKMFFHDGHAEEGFWINGVCAFREKPDDEQIAEFIRKQEEIARQEEEALAEENERRRIAKEKRERMIQQLREQQAREKEGGDRFYAAEPVSKVEEEINNAVRGNVTGSDNENLNWEDASGKEEAEPAEAVMAETSEVAASADEALTAEQADNAGSTFEDSDFLVPDEPVEKEVKPETAKETPHISVFMRDGYLPAYEENPAEESFLETALYKPGEEYASFDALFEDEEDVKKDEPKEETPAALEDAI